jgi:hypothetical protein
MIEIFYFVTLLMITVKDFFKKVSCAFLQVYGIEIFVRKPLYPSYTMYIKLKLLVHLLLNMISSTGKMFSYIKTKIYYYIVSSQLFVIFALSSPVYCSLYFSHPAPFLSDWFTTGTNVLFFIQIQTWVSAIRQCIQLRVFTNWDRGLSELVQHLRW